MNQPYLYDRLYIPISLLDSSTGNILQDRFTYTIDGYDKVQVYPTFKFEDDMIVVPSGGWHKVEDLIDKDYVDGRPNRPSNHSLEFAGTLWDDQRSVLNSFLSTPTRSGFINSKAGSGKTVMACYLISKLRQKFCVIVPTSILLEQWADRIHTFLPNAKIGMLGQQQNSYDESCDGLIAIINSLRKESAIERFKDEFGLCIVDEAHRLPANSFRETINFFSSKYKVGLSANRTRKDNKHVMIEDFLGKECVVNYNPNVLQAQIIILQTGLPHSFKAKKDSWVETLNRICGDLNYNNLIARVVRRNVSKNRKVAVLTPRLFQIEQLSQLLADLPMGIITGETKQEDRNTIIDKVNNGSLNLLLCSKQIFEEGVDIRALDIIHLVGPSNNLEKLEQAIGRVERAMEGKPIPIVFDYWFNAPEKETLKTQQLARFSYYEELNYDIKVFSIDALL